MGKIEQFIEENGYEDVIIFKNPDYENAFIGVSHDNRAVYLFSKMIKCLMENDNISESEAVEFINYNTIRSLPYIGEKSPIIVFDTET